MSARRLIVCALCWGWSSWAHAAPAADGVDNPHAIRVLCDGGARFGAGLLVQDFRSGHEAGLLLLTALHVLQGCRSIEPVVVSCAAGVEHVLAAPWSTEHPVELLTWSALDLIAVVVPNGEHKALSTRVPAVALAADVDDVRPPFASTLNIAAKSGVNVCPRIPAQRRDVVKVAELYDALDMPDYYALFGSLSSRATVMSYESTAVEGVSGGPVYWLDDEHHAIVAIHLGGQEAVLQWGLLVARDLLVSALERDGSNAVARLDATHPSVAVRGFSAPTQLTQPQENLNAAAQVGLRRDGLFAMLESSTPVDPFGAVSNSLQLGWTHQWLSLPGLGLASLGTRALIAGSGGLLRSPVFFQQHVEPKLRGTAKLPFFGGFAEVDAELQLARAAPLHYALGLGLRIGASHLPDVEPAATHVSWGPIAYGRLHWRLSDRFSGVAQLHLTVTRIPADKTPLDCAGPSVRGPEVWDVWGGLAVGAELTP